ncbi:hypothetical protein [Paraburkholderia humisilvae]|uniref:Uncharacterized protein n=1 Tax=Paraburkholderia humisilvae TaxID=627669 RepID=A0A6J5F549_9BURK|nr:hypothetical protein [Paraburkholderia humisilvae]CAB3773604.1 hypothetical protein LMG29542_07340 [Paraburkholderia humisilvae]
MKLGVTYTPLAVQPSIQPAATPAATPAVSTEPTGGKHRLRRRGASAEQRVATGNLQKLLKVVRGKPQRNNKKSSARQRLRARGAHALADGDENEEPDYAEAQSEGEAALHASRVGAGQGAGGQQGSGSQQQQQEQRERQAPLMALELSRKRRAQARPGMPFNAGRPRSAAAAQPQATLDIASARAKLLALLDASLRTRTEKPLIHEATRVLADCLQARVRGTSPQQVASTLARIREILVKASGASQSAPRAPDSFSDAQQCLHLLAPLVLLSLHRPRLPASIGRSRAISHALSRQRRGRERQEEIRS